MDKQKEHGGLVSSIILILLLVSSSIFGIWAFASRQSYKNDVDKKIAEAVIVAKKQAQQEDAEKYAKEEKLPLKDLQGPATYGSLHIKYPKIWSAYITGGSLINAYFQPDFLPEIGGANSLYALRVTISANQYSQEAAQFSSLATGGQSKVTAYSFPQVPNAVGIRVDGQIIGGKQGSMVLMPVRDKTIEIWTESNQYLNDFNESILPNVTFIP